jgi:hypothetical protein
MSDSVLSEAGEALLTEESKQKIRDKAAEKQAQDRLYPDRKRDLDARVKDVLEKYLKDNDGPPKKPKKTKMR